jgi:hypothetical protein
LLGDVVMPALGQAEGAFSGALGHINIEDSSPTPATARIPRREPRRRRFIYL